MLKPNFRSRTFRRMGEYYKPIFDPDRFLCKKPYNVPWEHPFAKPAIALKKEEIIVKNQFIGSKNLA